MPESPRSSGNGAASEGSSASVDLIPIAPSALLKQSLQAARFGLDAWETNLHLWRIALDAARVIIHEQQDAALAQARAQLDASTRDSTAEAPTANFMGLLDGAPYARLGEAIVQAQRQALDAWAEAARPH